jgi:hypothetical protein
LFFSGSLGLTTSRKARMWFEFQPQSVSSLLVNGKAWNIDKKCQNPPFSDMIRKNDNIHHHLDLSFKLCYNTYK